MQDGVGWHTIEILLGLAIGAAAALTIAAHRPLMAPILSRLEPGCSAPEASDGLRYSDGAILGIAGASLVCDGQTGFWEQPEERRQRQKLLTGSMFALE